MSSHFFIESKHNGLVLDIKDGTKGANIITWPKNGGPNQLWEWREDMLISKAGYALDIKDGCRDAGTNAIAWNQHGGDNQRWKMEGDQIISKLTGLALDIKNQRHEAGVDVILWERHGSSNQAWKVVHTSPVLHELRNEQRLRSGQELVSRNGRFKFCVQHDGNLVVYNEGRALWSSETWQKGCAPYELAMQRDNHLCLYDCLGSCTWANGVQGKVSGKTSARMQDDGNLVVSMNVTELYGAQELTEDKEPLTNTKGRATGLSNRGNFVSKSTPVRLPKTPVVITKRKSSCLIHGILHLLHLWPTRIQNESNPTFLPNQGYSIVLSLHCKGHQKMPL